MLVALIIIFHPNFVFFLDNIDLSVRVSVRVRKKTSSKLTYSYTYSYTHIDIHAFLYHLYYEDPNLFTLTGLRSAVCSLRSSSPASQSVFCFSSTKLATKFFTPTLPHSPSLMSLSRIPVCLLLQLDKARDKARDKVFYSHTPILPHSPSLMSNVYGLMSLSRIIPHPPQPLFTQCAKILRRLIA